MYQRQVVLLPTRVDGNSRPDSSIRIPILIHLPPPGPTDQLPQFLKLGPTRPTFQPYHLGRHCILVHPGRVLQSSEHVDRVLFSRLNDFVLDILMDWGFHGAHKSGSWKSVVSSQKTPDLPMLIPLKSAESRYIGAELTAAPKERAATRPRPSAKPPEAMYGILSSLAARASCIVNPSFWRLRDRHTSTRPPMSSSPG
jgi:hypothetical protein